MSSDDYTFKCVAWSVNDPNRDNVQTEDVTDKKDEIFKAFKATIRYKFQIPGDITFYTGYKNFLGTIKPDVKVIDLTQTIYDVISSTNILVVRYDEKKTVAGGGVGNGATVTARSSTGAFAKGGMGYGGVIGQNGNATGGDAFGGDGRGENIWGTAGLAYGGQANVTKDGITAKSGRGVSGELVDDRVQ